MAMDLNTLSPGGRKSRKRVGRGPGSGTGKTAGRGEKGQKSRSGYSRRAGFEGGQMPLNRRLPKRGFRHETRFPMAVVNLDAIEKSFDAGADVTPEAVVNKGLASPEKGGLKVLGRGEVTKKFNVTANAISASAKEKIEAAGGSVTILDTPRGPKRKKKWAEVVAASGQETK